MEVTHHTIVGPCIAFRNVIIAWTMHSPCLFKELADFIVIVRNGSKKILTLCSEKMKSVNSMICPSRLRGKLWFLSFPFHWIS